MKIVKEGMQSFLIYCALCHGEDGKANVPQGKAIKARNLVSDPFKQGQSVYGIFKTLIDGVPGTQMLKGLVPDETERLKISHFVYAIREKKVELSQRRIIRSPKGQCPM